MRPFFFLATFCSFLLVTAHNHAVGQQRTNGTASAVYFDPAAVESGLLRIDFRSSTLKWIAFTVPEFTEVTAEMPFDVPGGVFQTGDRSFIATGLKESSGSGWIVRFHLTNASSPAIIKDETRDYVLLFDPMDVFWHETERRLYVLDYAGRDLWAAPYSGAGMLPGTTGPNRFAVILTEQVPRLANMTLSTVLEAPSQGEPGGVAALEFDHLEYTHFFLNGSIWTWEDKRATVPTSLPQWTVWDARHTNAFGPLFIRGYAGGYELKDRENGATVSRGVSDPDPMVYSEVALPAGGLVPGRRFHVLGAPGELVQDSPGFLAMARYGAPTSTTQASMPKVAGRQLFTNRPGFAVHEMAVWGPGFDQSITFPVYAWLAFRQPDETDPITQMGGATVLDPAKLFATLGPGSVTIDDDIVHGQFRFPLPIPDDPNLVGEVLFWQFLAVAPPGNQVIVSDILGGTILAHGSGSSSQLTEEQTTSAAERSAAIDKQQRARNKWITAHPTLRMTGEKRRVITEIVRSLRRRESPDYKHPPQRPGA